MTVSFTETGAQTRPGAEGILFPDAEALVCNALRQPLIGDMKIGIRVPNPRPDEFIRVMRTGGPRETLVSEAVQVTVEAWAVTEFRASQILGQCRAILNASDKTLYGARELSGPINLPDPVSSQIRYTMSFQLRVRGQAVNL